MILQQTRRSVCTLFVLFALFSATACGVTNAAGASPATTAFTVTSVDLVVSPNTIAGKACGTAVSFTYTTTFHIPAGTPGGTIQFMYTTTNGRGSTNASVSVPTGATTATYTFTSSGVLPPDHTFPGIAEVSVTSPNAVNSPQVSVAGACTSGAFAVSSVDLVVNPNTIAGKACGTAVSFTYTATFHIPAGNPGGTIQFMYTTNNGRGSTNASVPVAPGATTATYSFTSTGPLPPDHTFPGIAEVSVMSPNAINSPQVSVAGSCASGAFHVNSIDMAVSPTTVTGLTCGTTLSVTWTATIHLVANGPGGTIQLSYSWNEGRGSTDTSVTAAPGATTVTFAFTHTDKVEPDHSFPQYGSIQVTSPNLLTSPQVTPSGTCHS